VNPVLRMVTHSYAWLLRFYPSSFRDEFGDEMLEVFSDLVEEAENRNRTSVMVTFLRELRDWPRVAFIEHRQRLITSLRRTAWSNLTRPSSSLLRFNTMREIMNEMNRSQQLHIDDKRVAILAGLPLLLFGLGITLHALIYQGPWYVVPAWRLILSIVIGVLPMIAIAVGAIIAIARRLPDWGWTWLGCAYMGMVLFVKTLVEEMADEGRPLTSPTGETAILILTLVIGAALILAAALRGWKRAGLLSIGFAGTLGLSMFMAVTAAPFNRTDLALLAAPLGLLMTSLIYTFTRGTDPAQYAAILGVGLVNVGLIVMANQVWTFWLADRGSSSPLLPLLVLSAISLLVGPIAGLFLRPIQRTFGRA
jgi:hypothetical protein